MSLFDVIKYPISNPPTLSELAALPRNILASWFKITEWKSIDYDDKSISNIFMYYNRDHSRYKDIVKLKTQELQKLRKIIREYDEPI
jgi:hypothetical protein